MLVDFPPLRLEVCRSPHSRMVQRHTFPASPIYDLNRNDKMLAGYRRSPRNSRSPTGAQAFQIGLYDPAEADLEHVWDSCSAGFLGERLYILFFFKAAASSAEADVSSVSGDSCPCWSIDTTRAARASCSHGFEALHFRPQQVPRTCTEATSIDISGQHCIFSKCYLPVAKGHMVD